RRLSVSNPFCLSFQQAIRIEHKSSGSFFTIPQQNTQPKQLSGHPLANDATQMRVRSCLLSAPPRLCVRQFLTLADKPTSATHFSSGAMLAFRKTKAEWEVRVQSYLNTYESPSHTSVLPHNNTFIDFHPRFFFFA
ncbi:MAG: hypothetical protein P8M30_10905, partial [Planctomycetaceae bacterium]|nr:hypothetical protein [Planctomycetaceae bacterium]